MIVRARLVRVDAKGAAVGVVEAIAPARDGRERAPAVGATVFARGGWAGELADVAVEHVRRDGTVFGTVVDVITASPSRVDARCPRFLDCGGCDFLHVALDAQHAVKRSRVADALGLPLERVEPVVASPRTDGYRALAKLVVSADRRLGSYRPRTHDVADMQGCLVHAPEAERIVEALRAIVRAPPALDLRYVIVRASLDEGRAVVTLVTRTAEAPGLDAIVAALSAREDVARIAHHVNDDRGDALLGRGGFDVRYDAGPVAERIGAVTQTIEPGAFNQINPLGAAALYAVAVAGADAAGREVAELYAGSGGLSGALLAAGASRVVSVELGAEAVAAARASSSAWPGALEARCGAVEDHLDVLGGAPIVVVNPPRKGLSEIARTAIAEADWERLVYVSCNPDTLARDVSAWPGAIVRVTPVDLFPHTRHVETVLVIERSPTAVAGA